MSTPAEMVIDIAELTVEGVAPDEVTRLRVVIEAALAQVARRLAGQPGPAEGAAALGALQLDLREVRSLMAPGAETELARRLEAAIRAEWEGAR